MPIIRQPEAIIACASVVTRDVDAVMHTATIVVIIALVHIFTALAVSTVTSLTDALEGLWGILAQSIDVTVICTDGTLIDVCRSDISHYSASVAEDKKQT